MQVLEAEAIRLLHVGSFSKDTSIIVAMRGQLKDGVVADRLVQLLETSVIGASTPATMDKTMQAVLDSEWYM